MRPALALLLLAALGPAASPSGTERRARAVQRGLEFLYRSACDEKSFLDYGADYLWSFYCIGTTSRDAGLRSTALRMGRERAAVWRGQNRNLPADAGPGWIYNLVSGSYTAAKLGAPDDRLDAELRQAVPRFTARDYLRFDPAAEPPPANIPESCSRCSSENERGTTRCARCGSRLTFLSPYSVWHSALVGAYTGDKFGVRFGASYADVLRWRRVLLPYRSAPDNADFFETAYAVFHLVYTLNDYSLRRLSPRDLPEEFAFLKANLKQAIAGRDPEMTGEFLDSLRTFGLGEKDPLIRAGMEYLLSAQNPDGSWGDPNAHDSYDRYHPTWTAVDGLRDYRWRGIERVRLAP